jgi:hypothetical protein
VVLGFTVGSHLLLYLPPQQYEPLEMPDPPRLRCTYLPDFANIKDLTSFFEMFVKDKDFDVIVANTNKYIE